MLAARHWAKFWQNARIRIFTDNTQALSWINKGTSRNPTAMSLIREIFWLSVKYNFHLTAVHIKGCDNSATDLLSHLDNLTNLHMFLSKFAPNPITVFQGQPQTQ